MGGSAHEAALDGRGEAVDLCSDDGAGCFRGAGGAAVCAECQHDFKWLRDARYAPGSAQGVADAPVFLPVEIVSPTRSEVARAILPDSALPGCVLEVEIAGGHRLRVSGAYDPEALARLIRGLSG